MWFLASMSIHLGCVVPKLLQDHFIRNVLLDFRLNVGLNEIRTQMNITILAVDKQITGNRNPLVVSEMKHADRRKSLDNHSVSFMQSKKKKSTDICRLHRSKHWMSVPTATHF